MTVRPSVLRRLAIVPVALTPFVWSPADGAGPAAEGRSTSSPAGVVPAVSHELDASLEPLRSAGGAAWGDATAPFAVRVGDESVPYGVLATVVLPGEELSIAAPATGGPYRLLHRDGAARETGVAAWTWMAPGTAGVVPLRVEDANTGESVHLQVFVARPRTDVRNGSLNGYRIGSYVEKPLRGLEAYIPPRGFVEVRAEDRDLLVSPHFTLGQFLCKQPGEPRYVSLSAPLLVKLEAVLAATNRAGYRAPTLHVMSGFRTPAYNRAIGNRTVYSRHLWGDAADVFVDADGNGDMDDLNGDGRSNLEDARVLSAIVDSVEREKGIRQGGLGLYRRNSAHGPFVHVDARGYTARW